MPNIRSIVAGVLCTGALVGVGYGGLKIINKSEARNCGTTIGDKHKVPTLGEKLSETLTFSDNDRFDYANTADSIKSKQNSPAVKLREAIIKKYASKPSVEESKKIILDKLTKTAKKVRP